MRLGLAATVLVLSVVPALVPVPTAIAQQPPSRCAAAAQLLESQREIAIAQLTKALADPATRQCAVDELIEAAAAGESGAGESGDGPYTHCTAGNELLASGLTEEAKGQYQKALEGDAPDACGAAGLVKVQAKEDEAYTHCQAGDDLLALGLIDEAKGQYEKVLEGDAPEGCAVTGLDEVQTAEYDESDVSIADVWDALVDVAKQAWPWVALVAAFGFVRLVLGRNRFVVQSSKDDENLAKRVSAAANASGSGGPSPAKVVTGQEESLPENTIADISKVLRLPATAVLTEALRLAAQFPLTLNRLNVSSAVAGGRAVIELDLRRTFHRTKARIGLQVGDLNADKTTEVLGLIGGAWLVARLAKPKDWPPFHTDNEDAAIYEACFRAGAICQSRGETETARACYAAMPDGDVFRGDAPFAWLGSRLNEMMALENEGRREEALRFADAIDSDSVDFSGFDPEQVEDLQRRRRYMLAVVRVEHYYAAKATDAVEQAARKAVRALDGDAQDRKDDSPSTTTLRAAIRMVQLCFDIVHGDHVDIERVKSELLPSTYRPTSPDPILGGAAYYDAACAITMVAKAKTDFDVALDMLETAVAATPEARRPRVRAMAENDEMLAPLHGMPRFDEILGKKPEPKPEEEPSLVEQLLTVLRKV